MKTKLQKLYKIPSQHHFQILVSIIFTSFCLIYQVSESKFVIPPIDTSSITNVTTLDELKTLVTDTYWTPLNALCGADCGPTKDEFLTEMETEWGEGLEDVLAMKTLFTTTANSMKTKVEADFR